MSEAPRKIIVRAMPQKQRIDEELKDDALVLEEEGVVARDSIFERGKSLKPVRGCFGEELANKVGLYENVCYARCR